MSDYFICPNCGTEVPLKALVCPECGSDENTGWSEDTMYDELDLPEVEESKTKTTTSLFQNKYFLYIVAILALLAFLWIYVLQKQGWSGKSVDNSDYEITDDLLEYLQQWLIHHIQEIDKKYTNCFNKHSIE